MKWYLKLLIISAIDWRTDLIIRLTKEVFVLLVSQNRVQEVEYFLCLSIAGEGCFILRIFFARLSVRGVVFNFQLVFLISVAQAHLSLVTLRIWNQGAIGSRVCQ